MNRFNQVGRFSSFFPRQDTAVRHIQVPRDIFLVKALNPKNVLVVDDETAVRKAIAQAVRSLGYRCRTAANGPEALDLIRRNGLDIIISDVRMPGLDGLELMAKAREIKPGIPFIIVTGYAEEYPYGKIVRAGADDFIEKPFTRAEIRYKLDRVVKERRLTRDNDRLLSEQAALNEKLAAILQMSRNLTADLHFDRLFELIISKVTEVMEAQRTSLYLIDWESREIWTKVAQQIDQIRLPLGQGISGRVAETGKKINVGDAWRLTYFQRDFDLKNNFRTRSVLCLPVQNRKQERIAVIQVLNKGNGSRFDENDEFILEAFGSQVAVSLENSFLMDELQISFESSIKTLSATVDSRHPLTAGHSQRVTEYASLIAREMGLGEEELKVIKYAALLHDIGKIGIRDDVLMKDGSFTPEERVEMNTHSVRTRNILENFHFPRSLRRVPQIASQHHEKINGKGYPDGVSGENLPLLSKILAVADAFDALTSRRDYPKYCGNTTMTCEPMPPARVIQILQDEAGTHFDRDVIAAFFKCLPQVLETFHGSHFSPWYVEEMVRSLKAPILVAVPKK
jgi:putative nucleotidyltransferase with HDIG domain